MNLNGTEQSIISLYSGFMDPYSHRVRIVVQEKEAAHDLILVDEDEPSEDFLSLSPYQSLPVLVDKDLVLFDPRTILEYLDERFPHPPLLPVDPAEKANIRQMLMRIDHDWTPKVVEMQKTANSKKTTILLKELKESFMMLAPLFSQHEFFMRDEFSLVDSALAPILWYLDSHGVTYPKSAQAVTDYTERLFSRDTFQTSLTEYEEELREIA